MANYIEIAKNYIDNGYWVIPVSSKKTPSINNWTQYQNRPMNDAEIESQFKNCYGIALLCGGIPSVELTDWDLKYSLDENFYNTVKEEVPDSIKRKCFVQTTMNNGVHWWYKVPKESISPNQKLACRYTTAYEKDKVYREYYKDPKTRDNALKIAINDNSRVLIETRGGESSGKSCGGYGLIFPTPGYNIIYSPEGGMQELTVQEHELLLSIFRSYNEVSEVGIVKNREYDGVNWSVSPFEDFNDRGDALALLYESGWEEVGKSGKSIRLKRPGASSGSSALYDLSTNILNIFSTSTRFDNTKGYNPTGIFIELEADGDGSLGYRKLVDLGYGVKQ